MGVAFLVFAAFSGPMLLRQSSAPHFVYQAAGFLQGELAIPGEPPNHNDWVKQGDRWFVSFPPFPAFLMTPFVAFHGLAFNDVFLTVFLAALAIGLFVSLVRSLRAMGEHDRKDPEVLAFAAFLAFGTVFFPSAIRGEVWFTAHVVGLGLTSIYLLSSLRARWPVVAGIAFGCAALTRANLVFAFPFFLWEAFRWARIDRPDGWFGRFLVRCAQFGLPAAAVLLLGFWMNHERFGDWSEFGHRLLYRNRVNSRIAEYGLFHPHFLGENLRSAFLLIPRLSLDPLRLRFDGNGMSLFVTTPLLLLVPFARRWTPTMVALAVTAFAIALPGLFYMNNGWYQFGYRFANDYLPYLFLLLVLGGRRLSPPVTALGLAGILVCSWGALVFNRF